MQGDKTKPDDGANIGVAPPRGEEASSSQSVHLKESKRPQLQELASKQKSRTAIVLDHQNSSQVFEVSLKLIKMLAAVMICARTLKNCLRKVL